MSNDKTLFTYYSLAESANPDKVIKKLNSLSDDGKICMNIDGDTLKIEDIELSEKELDNLIDLFDKNDIIPDLDKTEENWDDLDNIDFDEDDNW